MDLLNQKIIEETIRGGPPYYRPSYTPTQDISRYRHDSEERRGRRAVRAKVLCVRLPWLFAIIRLPAWSPIGVALD